MRSKTFILVAAFVALLLFGAVGVYAYDASRDDLIADGVMVGGVDVGSMRVSKARTLLRERLADPLQRPIVVRARGRGFRMSAQTARLRADVEGMVQEALHESRRGSLISRTVRGITGDEVKADLPARVSYSKASVARLVRRVKKRIDRRAQDAKVSYSATAINVEGGSTGLAVRGRELERKVRAEITLANADRVIKARTKVTKPRTTREQLVQSNKYFLAVDRGGFRLRFFKDLKLAKAYTVAIGAQGYETPAGLYHIQNKQVDPIWHVPDKDWAGKLRGKTVPGGVPQNPLKARWLGIYNGAGIHGTDNIGSLGSAASHGCVRMAIPDVKELYEEVPVQTPVYIG